MTKSANYCIWQNITINLGRRIKTGCANEELFVGMVVRAFLCGGGAETAFKAGINGLRSR